MQNITDGHTDRHTYRQSDFLSSCRSQKPKNEKFQKFSKFKGNCGAVMNDSIVKLRVQGQLLVNSWFKTEKVYLTLKVDPELVSVMANV